ncbi:SigE family RNA polymerase sigma factor [Streptomyces tateyamensis]|uniref:SigE family RNA polymerase sigma factor n=1 Tax=Streptomyces tateyamensis TaxID=565073 RepID=A0A2V4NFV5_9ACTN|nr:SigE family RNA polymerase sigma factor [Streptomyces tateyamensis]PYC82725.1 SigE family RNA polymerase sigma factor [Streptomyces tateyamensis]
MSRQDTADPFDTFVAARYTALLRAAYLITADPHEAGDLLHDSLARVYPKRHAIRDPALVEGYLRRTMVRTHVSRWRRSRREAATDRPPELPVEPAERDLALEAALRALPPRQRAAVALHYYLDLSTAQVAEELGCSQATAKTHLARALKALRIRLAEQREEAGRGE